MIIIITVVMIIIIVMIVKELDSVRRSFELSESVPTLIISPT